LSKKESNMKAQAIKTDQYLNSQQIKEHLKNVEYIIMAAPAPDTFKQTPIHFTLFLNTDEELPKNYTRGNTRKIFTRAKN